MRVQSYTTDPDSGGRVPMSRFVLSLLVGCLLPIAACSGVGSAQSRAPDAAPRKVRAIAVRPDTVRRTIEIVGTLAAAEEVTISSEVEGKVSRLHADLG